MAELLIMARSATHPDPAKDRAGCWKRGMVVTVQPDGHRWGKRETAPAFCVLKMPGIPVDRVEKYLVAYDVQDGFEEDGETARMATYRRRAWAVQLDELPSATRQKADAAGELVMSRDGDLRDWDATKALLLDTRTGLRETKDITREVSRG